MTAPVGSLDSSAVLALRAQILARNAALSPAAPAPAAGFGEAIQSALRAVNSGQAAAAEASTAYERGDTADIASVMLARQKASIGFEATLQVRNKLLAAYRDVMSMPVRALWRWPNRRAACRACDSASSG